MIDQLRSTLELISLALVSIISLITGFNLVTVRKPKNFKEISASVAILIPMRDEERNASLVIQSCLAQEGLPNLQIRALDDHSRDGTRGLIEKIKDPRFSWRPGQDLPSGWLGKNFALATLASEIDSDYLVFIDADVRLESTAIASSITLMDKLNLDYISPYPRQIALSPIERLLQPLLQWSWFASLPLLLAERSLRASTVVANGQFFIVRRSAYLECGGHSSIKGEVLDDIELARSLRAQGFRGTVVDGTDVASCRMYESASALVDGYSKSQWRAFGSTIGAVIAIKLLALTSLVPVALAILGWKFGWVCYLLVLTTRLLVAIRTRSSLISPWLHPVAIAVWIWLILRSIYLKRIGELNWRGRPI